MIIWRDVGRPLVAAPGRRGFGPRQLEQGGGRRVEWPSPLSRSLHLGNDIVCIGALA
ncbi:MAG: hypothetical protein ACI9LT_000274 [Pseudoalteromonas distincta]|jgi:hypothetical protein